MLARLLGYDGRTTYIDARSFADRTSNHIIRQAISGIGATGVFALEDGFRPSSLKPIVYLAAADDAASLRAIRRNVWSQGAVPFLLVVTPDKVEICNGFQPPSASTISVEFADDASALPDALVSFAADRISASITWSDFTIHRDASIDNNLVNAIELLNEHARLEFPEFRNNRDLINALIGKFIYIYVLVDRGILSMEWLSSRLPTRARRAGQAFLQAVFAKDVQTADNWSAPSAVAVFDVVDDAINGSVFALTAEQRARIPDGLCHLIHRVVRRGEVLYKDGAQLGFFDVSFSVLRTETISAIYERFVSIEDAAGKKDDGVFYTPPHLADHVLDRLEAASPISAQSRLIDPAAGSGIFLVGAFRRLMERNVPSGGWQPRHIGRAKSLLLKTIHGIEKHSQAANVCRFSLYLTLLDYVGRASIEKLIRAAGDAKFLPDLRKNIVSADAFASKAPAAKYTHVVGNPPWPMSTGQKDRTNQGGERRAESAEVLRFADELQKAKLAFGHNRLSDLFTWLAVRRLAADGAAMAFVLPAKSVIGRNASNFAHCLASNVTIEWIGNLSHLRRKLFEGVEAPACVVVATNRMPSPSDRTAVYRPLLSSLPGGRRNEIWSLLASSVDVQTIRSVDLQRGPSGWFVHSMLGEFDRRMHESLKTWATVKKRTLGDFLERSGLLMSKGGSPAETGVQRKAHNGKSVQLHFLERDELVGVSPDFRGWFSGNVILIPRSFNEAAYYKGPVAYPSSFNAIIPATQERDSQQRPIEEEAMPYLSAQSVDCFLRYMNSSVLRYFASLFGASYLMDKARFEKNDLQALPCPFVDINDVDLLALESSTSVDDSILDAMKAGADFRAAFREFDDFRQHFANAQVPPDSQRLVSETARETYVARLVAELQASFGLRHEVNVRVDNHDRRTFVSIALGRKLSSGVSMVDVSGQFLGTSIVTYDSESDVSLIVKSPTRHAWTIDQAVADAMAVSREIRSAR
ncbi:N-6 DNA methylase [Bradyrhizobium liaoningense]|uniref:N-6 DNA methylase n=1 Tax=Bradyrhizobium liaoningense TaxID=43992 RepID=UPI001BACE2D0|nr:N-6 DNA methylase [Bradyrhizobium liaoningense]